MPVDKCTKCGVTIKEFLTGRKKINGQIHCDDCYYEEFGNVIEENPIGVPRNISRKNKKCSH